MMPAGPGMGTLRPKGKAAVSGYNEDRGGRQNVVSMEAHYHAWLRSGRIFSMVALPFAGVGATERASACSLTRA